MCGNDQNVNRTTCQQTMNPVAPIMIISALLLLPRLQMVKPRSPKRTADLNTGSILTGSSYKIPAYFSSALHQNILLFVSPKRIPDSCRPHMENNMHKFTSLSLFCPAQPALINVLGFLKEESMGTTIFFSLNSPIWRKWSINSFNFLASVTFLQKPLIIDHPHYRRFADIKSSIPV